MTKDGKLKLIMIASMIILAAATRFLPHPPNFTPLLAIAVFGGAMFKNKYMAIALPIGAMFLSDLIIGLHSSLPAVYLSIGLAILTGRMIHNKTSVFNIAGTSLLSAIVFFLVTNFASWLAIPQYTKDFAGLMNAYQMGIPFFRNTLLSTGLFATVLFGSFALAERMLPQFKTKEIYIK